MPLILSCYYLDEDLVGDELDFVRQALIGPWAKFKTGAAALEQKRVPAVLPLPDQAGLYQQDREQRAERVRANLRHSGIRADAGRQIAWVTPPDADWDAIFQFAIRAETGYAPYVVQRWHTVDGRRIRQPVRVIDAELLLRSL